MLEYQLIGFSIDYWPVCKSVQKFIVIVAHNNARFQRLWPYDYDYGLNINIRYKQL